MVPLNDERAPQERSTFAGAEEAAFGGPKSSTGQYAMPSTPDTAVNKDMASPEKLSISTEPNGANNEPSAPVQLEEKPKRSALKIALIMFALGVSSIMTPTH